MQQYPLPSFMMIDFPRHPEEDTHPGDLQQVLVFLAELHRFSLSAKQAA